jgi:PAS domain S-box-containing protein
LFENRQVVTANFGPQTHASTGLRHVLVVDDEPEILTAVADLLDDLFVVHLASDATQALAILRQHPIAVLVTDQRMPGMAGDELLAEAASCSQATRVLFTGYSDLPAVVRAVNRGHIYAYIAKPWEPMELCLTLSRAAEHHDLVQSLNHERMLLGQLMENVPDAIFFKDRSQRFTRVNRAKAELVGAQDPRSLIGLADWDFFPPHEAARIQAEDLAVINEGRRVVDQVEVYTPPDGKERWFSTTKVPLDGRLGLVGISRDITERKHAEHQLEVMTTALLRAEKEKEAFGRQVVTAVTGGRFHLVDAAEIPPLEDVVFSLPLDGPDSHRQMRAALRLLGHEVGLAEDSIGELVLASGEAATNTVKHATRGECRAGRLADGVVVRISDHGPGIGRAELPQSLFRAGYSSKVSLGMGYTVILDVMDEVWLATEPSGTIVQLVKRVQPPHDGPDLEALLDRFQ